MTKQNQINFEVRYYGGFNKDQLNSILKTTEILTEPKLSAFRDVLFLRKDKFGLKKLIVVKKVDDDWFIFGKNNANGNCYYYTIPNKYKTHIVEILEQYEPKKCHGPPGEKHCWVNYDIILKMTDDLFLVGPGTEFKDRADVEAFAWY